MNPANAIEVHGLSKRFRLGQRLRYRRLGESVAAAAKRTVRSHDRPAAPTIWAVRDVSFEVGRGEVFGVIGRNGAGKSVLFSMLARIIRPTRGSADIAGTVSALIEVGTGFHPELTGRENVYLNGAILGMTRIEINRRFDEIVEFSELEQFIDTPVKRYSSGMKVRLGFSIVAQLDPDVMLLDEVLAVGDAGFMERCKSRIDEIASGGTTILYVSHHLDEVRRLCNRVMWLDEGRLVRIGDPADVIDAYTDRFAGAETYASAGRLVTLTGWRVLGDGGAAHTISDVRNVRLAFDVVANRRLVLKEFSLYVDDQDSITVGSWSAPLDLEAGPNTVVAEFEGFPVRPGPYTIRLLFAEGRRDRDSFHCTPQMTVVAPAEDGLSARRIGVLNVPCRFEVRSDTRESRGAPS